MLGVKMVHSKIPGSRKKTLSQYQYLKSTAQFTYAYFLDFISSFL
jgi:hypothetical protein